VGFCPNIIGEGVPCIDNRIFASVLYQLKQQREAAGFGACQQVIYRPFSMTERHPQENEIMLRLLTQALFWHGGKGGALDGSALRGMWSRLFSGSSKIWTTGAAEW
jgi:hypothetical protein